MKHYRNVRSDKSYYNNGKWDTVYSDDDIKRLAYYNIDLPHVVGIGTKIPFSKLSFGNSEGSGEHTTGKLLPGQITAIAMHEKSIEKALDGASTSTKYEGQDFVGLSFVEKIRSVRSTLDNTSASGLAIYSNKSNVEEDTALKTDQGIIYITDDKFVHVGGVPNGFDLIDKQEPAVLPGNIIQNQEGENVMTGPDILLDVSGSIHVNGFINFLKKGPNVSQLTDNPASQQTYDINSNKIVYVSDISKAEITRRAVPEGAIWVGWDKEEDSNGTRSLGLFPRLYIQRNGLNKKILTEDDNVGSNNNNNNNSNIEGFTWKGNDDDDNNKDGEHGFYVFRQPDTDSRPAQTLLNTYVGRHGINNDPDVFISSSTGTGNILPTLLTGTANGGIEERDPQNDRTPSALSVIGNLSVFDFTKGGSRGGQLTGKNDEIINNAKGILVSDIYKTNGESIDSTTSISQGELGSIYADRHIMIGGFSYDDSAAGDKIDSKFSYFTSAIDISGGISQRPVLRVITGDKGGTTLAKPGNDCKDSIIIGNIAAANFDRSNVESIIVGGGDLDNPTNNAAEVKGASRSIIMGTNNRVFDITNSLVVGNDLTVGNNTNNPIDGVVALGVGDVTVSNDERFVFATKDGNNNSVKALVIDKNAKVTINGPLQVTGEKILLEMQHVVAEDIGHELNGKEKTGVAAGNHETDSAGQLASTQGTTNNIHEGGMKLYLGAENDQDHFVQWTFDERNNVSSSYINNVHQGTELADRWTTALSSRKIGIAAAAAQVVNGKGLAGSEKFIVSNDGNLYIGPGGTIDINNDLDDDGESQAKFTVEASSGNVDLSGNLKVFGNINAGTNGNVTIAPNGTGKLIINSSGSLANNSSREEIQINGGYSSGGASFDISKNTAGAETTNLSISGKLTVDGDIDPTGLILEGSPGDYSSDSNKLVLYNDGGTLKYKVGSTTSTLAVGSSSGGGGGGQQTGGTIAFANDLKITGKNKIVYQQGDNDSAVIAHGAAGTYLKTGSESTAPSFAQIAYSEISSTPPTITTTQANNIVTNNGKVGYTDDLVKIALGSTGGAGGAVETITLKENGNNSRTISVGKAETAGESSNLILQGGEAKAGQGGNMDGGNIELRGGAPDGNGNQGDVLLAGNNVTLNSTILSLNNTIQSKTDNTTGKFILRGPPVTRATAADDIYIQGGNNTGTDAASRGGNVIIEGGPGGTNSFEGVIQLNTWVSNKTERNGITIAPNGTWNAAGASTGGGWGQVWLNRAIQSTSTTGGALRVDGGVGIGKNLHVGGTITSSGNLNVTGTITGDTSLTLDQTTITTAEIGVLDGVTHGTATASKALVVDSNKDIGNIRNLTVSGNIVSSGRVINKTPTTTITQNDSVNAGGNTVITPAQLINGFITLISGISGSNNLPSTNQQTLKLPTANAIKNLIGSTVLTVGHSFRFTIKNVLLTSATNNIAGNYLITNTGISLYANKNGGSTTVANSTDIQFWLSEFVCICTNASTPTFDVHQLWFKKT